MAANNRTKELLTRTCHICKSGPLEKVQYISHILGKRHQKNLKNRSKGLRKDELKRTLHVTGYNKTVPPESLLGVFWEYDVLNVSPNGTYSFIELRTKQDVKEVLGNEHFIGDRKLKVNVRHQAQHATESPPLKLSWRVTNALDRPFYSTQNQWNTVISLINDIELRPIDYEKRESLRMDIEQFLRPHFPMVAAHIFGSSSNNLGFTGCDIDLFVFLGGVNPWASGSKEEKEKRARDLTWYIARKIMNSRRYVKVQAIARARVPIVKFECPRTQVQIDLSFRHGMPVYNTQLICQYTRTHLIVRPYLMVIRYWAKIQDIAGGGQPSYLITNYGLTMLMLFYLMVRTPPIIPSVMQLKSQVPPDFSGQHTIDGWDCTFGKDINMWSLRRHNESVLELVEGFFRYYSDLDTKRWVISPLTGQLLDKIAVKERNGHVLPPCMRHYCMQETEIQLESPICLQDPFEHSFNITRGLQEGPLVEFQYKCKVAAEITAAVIEGVIPLSKLFEDIEIDESVLNDIKEYDTPKEADISQEEVITLDDSDTSQDEIEVLNASNADVKKSDATSSSKENGKNDDDDDDFLVLGDFFEVSKNLNNKSDFLSSKKGKDNSSSNNKLDISCIELDISSNDNITKNELDDSCIEIITNHSSDSGVEVIMEKNLPENKEFKFELDFSKIKEFTITFDGSISAEQKVMSSKDSIAQAACSLVQFVLQQCLKIDITPVEMNSKKKQNSDFLEEQCPKIDSTVEMQCEEKQKSESLDEHADVIPVEIVCDEKQKPKSLEENNDITPVTMESLNENADVTSAEIVCDEKQKPKSSEENSDITSVTMECEDKENFNKIEEECSDVTSIEIKSESKKRKSDDVEEIAEHNKRLKHNNEDNLSSSGKHHKLAMYTCSAESQLWVGRKRTARAVPFNLNMNPLQYEMAVTEAQMTILPDNEVSKKRLDFSISLWQEVNKPSNILVTGDSVSSEKVTKSVMMPLFIYLQSLTPALLRKVDHYIVRTSSKR